MPALASYLERGAKLLRIGLVAQVLNQQKPMFVPDLPLAIGTPRHGSFCSRSCRTKHLLLPSIDGAKTLRNSVNAKVAGPAICPRKCRDAQCPGFPRCGRAECALAEITRSGINVSLPASATASAWCSKSIIMWPNWILTMSFARPRHRSVDILAVIPLLSGCSTRKLASFRKCCRTFLTGRDR